MLADLPVEILLDVFGFFELPELKASNLVNRRLRHVLMPIMWSHLEFTQMEKSRPGSMNKKRWLSSAKSCRSIFDRNIHGVWMVIGVQEIDDFVNRLGKDRLGSQLACVRTLNFDQYFMEPQEKRKWHGLLSRVKPSMYSWVKDCLSPEHFSNLQGIRLRTNNANPDEADSSFSILSKFNTPLYISTTGRFSIFDAATSVDVFRNVKAVEVTISDQEEFPKSIPSSVSYLEIRSKFPTSISATVVVDLIGALHRLYAISLTNICIYNPNSIQWIPKSVKVSSFDIGDSNYLEGRLGEVTEYPGVEALFVYEPYGFVRKILPTGLLKLELNYSERKIKDDFEINLLDRNKHLISVSLRCPLSLPIVTALKSLSELETLEIVITRQLTRNIEILPYLYGLNNLRHLTLLIHPSAQLVQVLIVWKFSKLRNLQSLHVVHSDITVAEKFAREFKEYSTVNLYQRPEGLIYDFVMNHVAMRRKYT